MGKKEKLWLCFLLAAALFISGCGSIAKEEQTIKQNRTELKIAVIDTGFSERAIPEENILPGKNYCDTQKTTEDTYGHGTAVASVILQYAPEGELVPFVSSSYEGGKLSQADSDTLAQIIYDAVDIFECSIINISAGFLQGNDAMEEATAYAASKGVVIIASAGNDYAVNGEQKYYPAAYPSVFAVGSCTEDGTEISAFSQRGDWVDFYAPGEKITVKTLSGNTKIDDGTSYSAAEVTAEVFLILEDNPGISLEEVKAELEKMFPKIQKSVASGTDT